MRSMTRVLRIVAVLFSLGLVSCVTPVKLLPPILISQMGVQNFSVIKQESPRETDPRKNRYVQCVANRILKQVGRRSIVNQWEVVLFRDPSVNAFALPGGKIGIYTGLLNVVDNQHQLAVVIGHEIGHIVLEHGNQQVSQDLLIKGGLATLERLIQDKEPQEKNKVMSSLELGAQVGLSLPYSRHHEYEADRVGLELMAKAGFDPRESLKFWEKMSRYGSQRYELLSTHPSDSNRMKELRGRMNYAWKLYSQASKAKCNASR